MNIIEMHAAVMQGVDKVHAQVADTLLADEIDLELNKAIQQFISSRFQKNNKYRQGFEESQKRRDDLRSLVVETYLDASFKEVLSDYNNEYPVFVDTCTLPGNYMFYINLQAQMWRSERCVALPYLVLNNQDEYYFAIDWNAGIGQNVDGLSTSYISSLSVVNIMPNVDDWLNGTLTNGSQVSVDYQTIWEWGQQWNNDPSAFTSNNDPSIYPANLNQVLGDILTYGVNGLLYAGNDGSYQDGGPDLETIDNIDVPNSIIYPWDAESTVDEENVSVPSIYSADLSNGWLSYVLAYGPEQFDSSGNIIPGDIVYQAPLRVSMEATSKRYPSSSNSLAINWTDSGILTEFNPVKLVQFDDVYSMTKDPFNKTKYSSPLSTMRENHIDLYTDETFIIDKVKLTYIRIPVQVESPNASSDLPLHTHEEIVKMAVSSILEGISDPRYKSHQLEVDKME